MVDRKVGTMKDKISVLGCGWLGLPLGELLVKNGHVVNGSTTSSNKLNVLQNLGINPFLIKAEPDLSGDGIADFFRSKILILNIPPGRRREDVEVFHFLQAKNISETAIQNGIEKIILIGSTSVYPNIDKIILESEPLDPRRPSGNALKKVEAHLSKLPVKKTIIRMAGLAGPGRMAGRFFAGKKDIPGGLNPVNMIHQKDAINIIYEIIRQDVWGEIFNAVADGHPTRRDFFTTQARKQGFELPSFLLEAPVNRIVSNQKIKKMINYKFIFSNPLDF